MSEKCTLVCSGLSGGYVIIDGAGKVRGRYKDSAIAAVHHADMFQELDRLQAEVRIANETIAKLDKTADDVPIVPGMKLVHEGNHWVVLSISKTGTLELSCWGDKTHRKATFGKYCYSTLEAAEAAKKNAETEVDTSG